MRLQPLPGAEADERVAPVIGGRTGRLRIRFTGIQLEKLLGALLN